MRLDIFLPSLGRRHGDTPPEPGRVRRALGKLGPSWLHSPLRRGIQAACLVLFCVLFFYVCWPYTARPDAEVAGWPSHYAEDLAAKEWIDAESFIALDPLVGISAAVAARAWVWSLWWAGAILVLCLVVPRGFCGYVCPLGTLIDLFDRAVGGRPGWLGVKRDGWWVNLRYYVLIAMLAAAVLGVTISGFAAAMPVVTRGFQFTLAPLQTGSLRGWHQVPPVDAGQYASLALFFIVFALGLLRPRFWCRHVCPTGAVFSATAALARITERKVEGTCTRCGRCAEVCSFGAVRTDFTTRVAECTFCQTCGGACPSRSIKFVERWNKAAVGPEAGPAPDGTPVTRRGFIAGTLSGLGVAFGIARASGWSSREVDPRRLPVRPPGSVPEREFLRLCVRCGECFKACPNNVLQPAGFEQGLDGLWTPRVAADWSGCESSCTNCGQVCPTGAIRALPLSEKRVARMGLAVVDTGTCLPWAEKEDCRLCADECAKAGYHAIEFERVGVRVDADGGPLPGTGFPAPVVLARRCVGCGLCQSICSLRNVKGGKLAASAVVVLSGPGREDRIMTGRYTALREEEERARRKKKERRRKELEGRGHGDFY